MTQWWVVTSAYNLNIRDDVEFETDDVTFRAFPEATRLYADGRSKKEHYATAKVTVKLSAGSAQDAVEHAERKVLPPISQALSLAHGHHVFFDGLYRGYDNGTEQGDPAYWSSSGVWAGDRTGYGGILQIPSNQLSFLEAVLPKLRDPKLKKSTGLGLALDLYLEPIHTADLPLELSFISYWLALEMLARHHARTKGYSAILGKEDFDRIRQAVESVLRELALRPEVSDQIHGRLGWFNELPIRSQIELLLTDYGLPSYTSEVKTFNKRRNDLLHGRTTSRKNFTYDFRQIMRLNEKVILKILGVYGAGYLHHSLADRDLLAR